MQAQPRSPLLEPGAPQCSDQFHPVLCDRNHDHGGPIGCFNSICEAMTAGAYHCEKLLSGCEPGLAASGTGIAPGGPPWLDVSAKNCDQFPVPVSCSANYNLPGQPYWACFLTMCDAVAAGAYHCTRQFRGTCEPQ